MNLQQKGTQPKGWRQFLPNLRFALKSGYPCHKSDEKYLTRKLVAQYHQQNIAVYAYTVNTTKRFEELLRYGIDGIFTDFPDLMLEVRTKKAPQ